MVVSIESQIIEDHLLNFFTRIGWNTQYQLVVKEGNTQGHILEAYIDLKDWIVNIVYPKGFLQRFIDLNLQNNLVGKYESTGMKHKLPSHLINNPQHEELITNVLYNFLSGVSFHEFGHSNECPIDNNYFSIILEAVSAALEKHKKMNDQILGYIVNIFTDTVLNTIYGLEDKNSFFRNSFLLFHYSELIQFGTIDPDFAFFVLLNQILYQFHPGIRTTIENKVVPKLPNNYQITLTKLVKIFCPFSVIASKMKTCTPLNETEKWKVINYLSDTDNWAQMSYDLADILSQFISANRMRTPKPLPDSSFTKKFKQEKEFKKEILDRIIERKMKKGKVKGIPGGMHKKKTTKRKKTSHGSGSKKKTKKKGQGGGGYPGDDNLGVGLGGFGSEMVLDGIYRHHAKRVTMKMPKSTTEMHMPITWMGRKIIQKGDSFENFDPLSVYFLPNDELLLHKKTSPLKINDPGTIGDKGFPNLAFFCDDSGSMGWNPLYAGGNYSALVIAVYSIFEWLKSQSFASVIKYNYTSFSATTRTTGWVDYFNIDKVKRQVFNYQGQGTFLDPDVFKRVLENPRKKAVIFVTDGEIANFPQLEKIIFKNRQNTAFLLLQIGRMSQFAEHLKKKGMNVFHIRDIHKLRVLMLDFVKTAYNKS